MKQITIDDDTFTLLVKTYLKEEIDSFEKDSTGWSTCPEDKSYYKKLIKAMKRVYNYHALQSEQYDV